MTPEVGGSTGSGLGLAIVQAIAAAHGGYVRLRSAPGAGTTVHLSIPVDFSPAPSRTRQRSAARPYR